jgi:hypothetical protein
VFSCCGRHALAAGWDCQADAALKDHAEALGYLTRLFQHLAPQCEPLPDVAGLATQIDNYIAAEHQKLATGDTERSRLQQEDTTKEQ